MGPCEPKKTPYAMVKEAAELIVAGGLKAEALQDARPAQWSKLIFNSSVNGVSALTGLPHSPHFADETDLSSLGHLLHHLIEEGKRVAKSCFEKHAKDLEALVSLLSDKEKEQLYASLKKLGLSAEEGSISEENHHKMEATGRTS